MLKIVFLLPVFSSVLISQNAATVDSTLREIETLYNSARYVDAELESRRLREELSLSDSVKVLIEKWIAFSLIAQGKTVPARERFVELLSLRPDFELDPVLTSPKILSVFNDARVKYLSCLRSRKKKKKIDMHGRTTTGSIFLGAGIATLGSGITFEILRANAREEYLKATNTSDIASKYSVYNSYRKTEIYSFIGFAVIYVASEIDVFTTSTSPDIAIRHSYNPVSGNFLSLSFKF
ncbi:MAG: hypothetical protein HYV29_10270 [Ignavibacteriales bacterium]|nr:hypothetical protein [Ignavibacteriales bacterium]